MGIARTVAIAQGKGGVGKTSVTSNIGGLAALAGLRTLIIDLDPQGNMARDLGMEPNNGQQLLSALVSGSDLPVVINVRDKLDVVPGGPEV